MTRRLLLLALVATLGCNEGGYAVQLRIETDARVSDEELARVAQIFVAVTGDESFNHTVQDAGPLLAGRQLNLIYKPALTSEGHCKVSVVAAEQDETRLIAVGTTEFDVRPGQTTKALVTLYPQGGNGGDMGADGGGTVVKKQGEPCQQGSDLCENGLFCVDGVCCNEACGDTCRACNVPNFVGTCTAVPDGDAPPHGTCPALAPDDVNKPCSTDGKCDGKGACRLHPVNTPCRAASCDPATNLFTAASVCDGMGRCVNIPPATCAPYKCNGAACFDTCTGAGTTECSPPNSCVGNSCGKLPDGRACTMDDQCMSCICADGLCCNARSQGQSEACNADATQPGKCLPVTGAPHLGNGRTACTNAGTACGGSCDGAKRDACVYPGAATQCRTQSCAVEGGVPTLTVAAGCDGAGGCPLTKQSCQAAAPPNTVAACGGTSCDYSQCAGGFKDCSAGVPGCETNIASDSNNCGDCNRVCSNVMSGSTCNGAGACVCTGGQVGCDSSSPPQCFTPSATNCCRPNGQNGCGCNYVSECQRWVNTGMFFYCAEWRYKVTCTGSFGCGYNFVDTRFNQTYQGGTCGGSSCQAVPPYALVTYCTARP